MGRTPKPWWDSEKKAYYIRRHNKRRRLGETKKEATKEFHRIMAGKDDPPVLRPGSVAEVIEFFLDWTESNRSESTYRWYRDFLVRGEMAFLKTFPELRVDELRPYHVQQWIDEHGWGGSTKRGAITAINRALNWAQKHGYIEKNPVRGIEKPEGGKRDKISRKEFRDILKKVKDREFADLLRFIWHSGCRPQEAIAAQAHHFFEDRLIFPKEESKGKKHPRVIFLSDMALRILRRNLQPEGYIFRNRRGHKWTAYAVNCRFERLKEKLGKKHCAYQLRHAYGHDSITRGNLSPEETAALMGHQSTQMIYERYGHLLDNAEFMRNAANRAKRGGT